MAINDTDRPICSNAEWDAFLDADAREVVIVATGEHPTTPGVDVKARADIAGNPTEESYAAFLPQALTAARDRLEGDAQPEPEGE